MRHIEDKGKLLAYAVDTQAHHDERGRVEETYRSSWFPELPPVKQLVQSTSRAHTLRGMHLHREQYDVWRFTQGTAVVRLYDHKTDAQALIVAKQDIVLAIPPGISHGFYTKGDCTLVYALTHEYDGTDEFGWYPFDGERLPDGENPWSKWPSTLAFLWVSDRDRNATRLADFAG